MSGTWDYDALVIGGGPAGSTAAAALARRGRRVLVAEKQRFPRFHIGESLLPASAEILHAIGAWDAIQGEDFVRKRGATFYNETEALGRIDFSDSPEVEDPVTLHVDRGRFDELLLNHASACGAEVRQGWRVESVGIEPDGVVARIARTARIGRGGEAAATEEIRVPVVIDASGQSGFLARKLGLRKTDPTLRNVAVHAQYEGVERPSGRRDGDIQIVSRSNLEWVWLIPLSDTLTSVGVVVPHSQAGAATRDEDWIERYIESIPVLSQWFEGASRKTPVRRDADFAYTAKTYSGDRWLMAGDSGAFLDPVFSTGVHLALLSGLEAGELVHRAHAAHGTDGTGDFSAAFLARHDRRQKARTRYFRRFAHGFYNPAFRDLLLQPANRFRLKEAMVAALAGLSEPKLATRARLALFFFLVALQKRFALAPRRHLPVRI